MFRPNRMPSQGRRIALACDNSELTEQALRWCIAEVCVSVCVRARKCA